jgi:hypothetical protein
MYQNHGNDDDGGGVGGLAIKLVGFCIVLFAAIDGGLAEEMEKQEEH